MEETPTQNPSPAAPRGNSNLGIPIAIVISAALIAAAIYFGGSSPSAPGIINTDQNPNEQVTPETTVAPVTEDDHIRGNPNAPILLVEYSDYDCPFCKQFHETLNRIMADYGTAGKVAWVYRHFPIKQLHVNAPKIAAASECVAELGGDQAFWTFSDLVFAERGINEPTDIGRLSEFAVAAGADKGQFDLCYNNGKYDDHILDDVQAAVDAGARGTPYTVVIVGDQQGLISGAQNYDDVKAIIDRLLSQIEGGELGS